MICSIPPVRYYAREAGDTTSGGLIRLPYWVSSWRNPLVSRRGLLTSTSKGEVKVTVQRPHEWEYLIDVLMWGGPIFGGAVLGALGKRIGNWIADQVGKKLVGGSTVAKMRVGTKSLDVDPDDLARTRSESLALIKEAAATDQVSEVLLPW